MRRAISVGAERVEVCNATYDAKRPRAKVRIPTMDAVVDRGLSMVGQQLDEVADGLVMNVVKRRLASHWTEERRT